MALDRLDSVAGAGRMEAAGGREQRADEALVDPKDQEEPRTHRPSPPLSRALRRDAGSRPLERARQDRVVHLGRRGTSDHHHVDGRRQKPPRTTKNLSEPTLHAVPRDRVADAPRHRDSQAPPAHRIRKPQQDHGPRWNPRPQTLDTPKLLAALDPARRGKGLAPCLVPGTRIRDQALLLGRRDDEPLAALGAASLQDSATRRGRVSLPETMGPVPLHLARLIRRLTLHCPTPSSEIARIRPPAVGDPSGESHSRTKSRIAA